jgi:N-acetylmuramoyl-L-alanine amidase
VAVLTPGDKVTVLKRTTGWCFVDYGGGKTGWIADWLAPISSRLTRPTTESGLKLFFPNVGREGKLAGDISQSAHVSSLTWQDSQDGTTAVIALKHPVGYKLTAADEGWRLTFGSWVTNLQFISDADGSRIRVSLDGQAEPTVAYDSENQAVMVKVPNATLAENAPTNLNGDGTLVTKVQASQAGTDVRIAVSSTRETAYSLTQVSGAVWEISFASPTLVGKTIALDPGHGMTDPGAMGTMGWNEKDYTHDVISRVRTLLQAAGAKTVVTREIQSPYIEAHGRAALINRSDADLFLSVHINSYTNTAISGLETYYYPRNNNERFARLVQNELVSTLGWPNRGVKSNTLLILPRETLTTGVLTEVGFISNPHDESQLFQTEVRQRIAEALYRAIERYFAE